MGLMQAHNISLCMDTVAAEFLLRSLEKLTKGEEGDGQNATAALFLVPTCELATQQMRALKRWLVRYEVEEYYGGKAIQTPKFDVLVSTPQAFMV